MEMGHDMRGILEKLSEKMMEIVKVIGKKFKISYGV